MVDVSAGGLGRILQPALQYADQLASIRRQPALNTPAGNALSHHHMPKGAYQLAPGPYCYCCTNHSDVTDGVSLGAPCCGVHDFKVPLASQRHRHCDEHRDYDGICAAVGCGNRANPKHTTCSEPEHRKLEVRGVESHTAMFQLRRRLERLKIYHPDDEGGGEANDVDDGSAGLSVGEITEVAFDGFCTAIGCMWSPC